jgi:hypothetical protein
MRSYKKKRKKREALIVVINLAPFSFLLLLSTFLSLCCRFSSITNAALQGLYDKEAPGYMKKKKAKSPYPLLSLKFHSRDLSVYSPVL